jgi:hypothetical protein
MKAILRRLPSPALIVACVALVVALGGVSYAAAVLPKNSVGAAQLQKKAVTTAKLRKSAVTGAKVKNGTLLAADFKAGQLPAGAQGPQGPKGDPGAPGKDGAQGPAGRSALTPLQAGESQSGVFAVGGPSTAAGQTHVAAVTFPIPLTHSLDGGHVVAVDGVASVAHCPGQGQADPGFLCLYVDARAQMLPTESDDIRNPAQPSQGADKRGFVILGESTNAGGGLIAGTWTYTEG